MSDPSEKKFTEKQEAFLEALFGEAEGDYKVARSIAGYSEKTPVNVIVEPLKDELHRRTVEAFATSGVTAFFNMMKVMEKPTDLGNSERLKAAKEILDRGGFKAKEQIEIKNESPLFILPPIKEEEEDDEV